MINSIQIIYNNHKTYYLISLTLIVLNDDKFNSIFIIITNFSYIINIIWMMINPILINFPFFYIIIIKILIINEIKYNIYNFINWVYSL